MESHSIILRLGFYIFRMDIEFVQPSLIAQLVRARGDLSDYYLVKKLNKHKVIILSILCQLYTDIIISSIKLYLLNTPWLSLKASS